LKNRRDMATKRSMFDLSDDEDFVQAVDETSKPVDQEVVAVPKTSGTPGMTSDQLARAEKNRLKAVALKKARLMTALDTGIKAPKHITGEDKADTSSQDRKKETIDTGAGFFIDDEDDDLLAAAVVQEKPAPIIDPDRPSCLECQEDFAESYLLRSFDYEVCDKCRDTEKDGKHELITKTDAAKEFLLKDFDFDKREPPLKFITRKNPHNQRWGMMKLYLRVQVEERALEVWDKPENLEKAHEERDERRQKAKSKKFMNKLKALRMQVRGSLYTKKDFAAEHVHEFGPEEVVDEDNDEYSRTCTSCGYVNKYEKM